ncbi:MAG: hypothetical protein PHO79_08190 [Desulfoplanes sp.]|nr:hypothetical protein [Desulfoplanes sp.]
MNGIFLIVIGLSIVIINLSLRGYTKRHPKNLISNHKFEMIKELEQKTPRQQTCNIRSGQRT